MSIQCAVILAALAAHASAHAAGDCADWSPAFEHGGLGYSAIGLTAVAFDDGSGPALYAGGSFTGTEGHPAANLARWNGQEWSSIGSPNGWVRTLVVFDDGSGAKLYVGGSFSAIGGVATGAVGCWDGSAWSAVGDIQHTVHKLAIHDEGSGAHIYAGGYFSVNQDAAQGKVARWNGSAWAVVGVADSFVQTLKSYDLGSGPALAVGGHFTQIDGQPLVRLAQWKTGAWSSLAGDADWVVYDFATFDDGGGSALYIGGHFDAIGGVTSRRLARWDGTSITAVPGFAIGSAPVNSTTTYDDGSGEALYVGGGFTTVNSNQAMSRVARWDGTSWQALANGFGGGSVDPWVQSLAAWDDGSGPGLVAVGRFDGASSASTMGIASWRGGVWSPIGRETGLRGTVRASTRYDSGSGEELILGGEFRFAGGVTCNNIARWNGTTLRPLGTGLADNPYTSPSPQVRAVCVFDSGSGPELYAGGSFETAGGLPCRNLARWNGSAWIPMFIGTANVGVTALCVYDDGTGPALFVAGKFTLLGSSNIAKWDGTAWSPLSTGCTAISSSSFEAISALAAYDDGSGAQLYAGGHLAVAGNINVFYLARWNGSEWSGVGSEITAPYVFENGVKVMHVANLGAGPKLYVAGGFNGAGGIPVSNIAVWDGAWSALASPGGAAPGRVSSIVDFDRGDGTGPALYLQSSFVADDGLATNGLARHDANGYSSIPAGLATLAPWSSNFVSKLSVFDDGVEPGDDLYVGGQFQGADGTLCLGLGRLRGCGEVGTSFCFGDGTAAACPCGNSSPVGARAGCSNSLGTGATVRARGVPSLSHDTLALHGDGMTNAPVLYFQGASITNGGAGVAFGDGIACVGGPSVRLATKANVGGASSYPVGADLPISIRGLVTSATTRHYSARYRNPAPFCTSATFNYASAVSIVWEP